MSEATYYFNSNDAGGVVSTWSTYLSVVDTAEGAWADTANAIDNNTATYAYCNTGYTVSDLILDTPAAASATGTISKVEIRIFGGVGTTGIPGRLYFSPRFIGGEGTKQDIQHAGYQWTSWFDVTSDTNAPGSWAWSDVEALGAYVEYSLGSGPAISVNCNSVEIKVTYTTIAEAWETTPANMIDNSITTDAKTTVNDSVQLLNGNTCVGTDLGTISKVEARIYGTRVHASNKIYLRPVFDGTDDGDTHDSGLFTEGWTSYVDITSDTNAPSGGAWTWADVQNLEMDVQSFVGTMWVLAAKVDLQVTYTAITPTLLLSNATLTGFTYVQGSGPSTEQSYNISGTDLNLTDVTITPPTNYEISLTSGSSFVSTPIILSAYDGTLDTIYVRLKAGLSTAAYASEVITNAGGGASTVNVTCTGEVTAVPVTGGTLTTNSKYW